MRKSLMIGVVIISILIFSGTTFALTYAASIIWDKPTGGSESAILMLAGTSLIGFSVLWRRKLLRK
jgi:LPXTG-motif cell wall-anchored protein